MSQINQILGNLSRCLKESVDGSFFAQYENFCLYSAFQPIYQSNGHLFGYEALLRVIDSESQTLFPDQFFDRYRLTPQIRINIDRLVRVMHMHNFSRCFSGRALFLNINPQSLADNNTQNLLRMYLSGYLDEIGLSLGQLYIEVIEESCDNEQNMLKVINSLRKDGLHFAIDDYGSGSSLEPRVRAMLPDVIKMDKQLVQDFINGNKSPLLKAVALAKEVKARVLIEGIEDEKSYKAAQSVNADLLQGYYLGQPLLSKNHLPQFSKILL